MAKDRDPSPAVGAPELEDLVSPFGAGSRVAHAPFASFRTPDAFLPLPWAAPARAEAHDERVGEAGTRYELDAGESAEAQGGGYASLDEAAWSESEEASETETLDGTSYEPEHEELSLGYASYESDGESPFAGDTSATASSGEDFAAESYAWESDELETIADEAGLDTLDTLDALDALDATDEDLADEDLALDEIPWGETYVDAESGPIDTWQRLIWTPAVNAAILAGNRDENKLANLVFHGRNRALEGRAILPHETALKREWIAIRDLIVRPALRQLARAPGATGSQGAPSGVSTAGPPPTNLKPLAGRLDAARRAAGEAAGELRMKVGRVARPWYRLRSTPLPLADNANEIRRLVLDDVVFVERELKRPGETLSWYYVFVAPPATGGGPTAGWIRSDGVALDPPEPGARIHYIESERETLIDIAARYYKPEDGFKWGEDARFYVAALAFANRDRAAIIFPAGWTDHDFQRRSGWKDIHIRRGHTLWIPSRDFMRTLQDRVSSGSTSAELWKDVKRLAKKLWDWIVFAAAFIAGLVHGALEAVYDVFADAVALVKTLWSVLKALVTGDIIAQAKKLWNAIKQIDVGAMVQDFRDKWNAADPWDRGYFRGHVCGYILAEIAMAIFSVGIATAVKWLGKAGKFAKVAMQLARRADFMEVAGTAEKVASKVPDDVSRRLRPRFDPDRTPDAPEPPRQPPAPSVPEPPSLQRMRGRVPDPDLAPLRLLPADAWNRVVAKARQNLAAFRKGGRARSGAVHSVKGTLLETLVVRMPIHREMMDWARARARHHGFDPDSVRFTMQVDDVVNATSGQALTDGIVYARHDDKLVVMAVFESKAQNFRLLAKEPGSVHGQIERSLARLETGAVHIDGVRWEPDQLRMMADYGERTRWAGIVPRGTLTPTQRANMIRDMGTSKGGQGRRFLVADGPLTEEGAFRIAESLLADLDAHP